MYVAVLPDKKNNLSPAQPGDMETKLANDTILCDLGLTSAAAAQQLCCTAIQTTAAPLRSCCRYMFTPHLARRMQPSTQQRLLAHALLPAWWGVYGRPRPSRCCCCCCCCRRGFGGGGSTDELRCPCCLFLVQSCLYARIFGILSVYLLCRSTLEDSNEITGQFSSRCVVLQCRGDEETLLGCPRLAIPA